MPWSRVGHCLRHPVDNSVEVVENLKGDLQLAGCRLGIFAKQPVPGRVKTRLTPPLTPQEAAEFYEISLKETLSRCQAAGLAPVLFFVGEASYFSEHFSGIERRPQVGGDLGERMAVALEGLLAEADCQAAALIGSDSPDLPLELIGEAFTVLRQRQNVVVPARDGGYTLIGMRSLRRELFKAIPWSSSEVLAVTRRRAEQDGIELVELAEWEDVDDLHSLQRLLQRSPWSLTARYAARQLTRHFSD